MGYRVTASDRSPRALEKARQQADGGGWPRCVKADYRRLPLNSGSFHIVINLFTGIGYYGDAGDRAVFAEARRVLRPTGAFVLEAMHRDLLMRPPRRGLPKRRRTHSASARTRVAIRPRSQLGLERNRRARRGGTLPREICAEVESAVARTYGDTLVNHRL
jgi:SAM-dependent methyltransferase